MNKLYCLIALLLISNISLGQKQGNVWMFGQGGALNFNSGTPVAFSGSQVFGNPTQPGDYLYSEGCTSISDSSGNLLFYSNGGKVWNNLNQIMPNGDSLKGFYSSTTAAFAVPIPLSDSLYYLFTTDAIERYLQNGLRYSVIDLCLDNGKGDIINSQKNILLLDTVSEKLCAIAHPNGTDIWLIAHKFFSNAFYAYLITSSGINAPIISHIGSIHIGNLNFYNGCGGAIGQMKASSDGNRIGLAFANATPAVTEVFVFDPLTGIVNNPISLTSDDGNYGVEFSPDNTKFYLTSISGIFQFDLTAGGGTQTAINASETLITNATCIPGPLQLGPDGKIYASQCTNVLGVINSPNNAGVTCNFVSGAINISPCIHNTSLPVFIAGYNYKNNSLPVCLPTGMNEQNTNEQILIYPNPIIQELNLHLKSNELSEIILYDIASRKLLQQKFINSVSLNTEQLAKGIYLYEVRNKNGVIKKGKVVKD